MNANSFLAIGAASASMLIAQPERISGNGLVMLEGGAVFDTDGSFRQDAVVVLQGERILRVGRVGQFTVPADTEIVDLKNRFVLPGFIDLHVHVRFQARVDTMRALLAHGVTTARSPGVYDHTVGVDLRDLVAKGEIAGPRLVSGGPFINGSRNRIPGMIKVESEEQMRAEIRRQKARGVDWIKLYWDVSPALVGVAVKEAHALGLRVAGHMRMTSWTEAAEAGIDSLEHSGADGPSWELVSDEQLRIKLRGQDPPGAVPPAFSAAEYYKALSASIDPTGPEMNALVDRMKERNVTSVPTLVIIQSLYYGDDLSILSRLEPERMAISITATFGTDWQRSNPFVTRNPIGRAQDLTAGKLLWPKAKEIVRTMHAKGVRIATGSDLGMPWITPGVSLHREMELLVEAGISCQDVLLCATRNAAEALGLYSELGSIVEGKHADVVVLRKNPLDDIRNTRTIEAVYRSGRRYQPADQ